MTTSPLDLAKEKFKSKLSEYSDYAQNDLSETDTRCKIIDSVLKDILKWPEESIKREPYVRETGGFIDYLLYTTHPYLIIEAKKIEWI